MPFGLCTKSLLTVVYSAKVTIIGHDLTFCVDSQSQDRTKPILFHSLCISVQVEWNLHSSQVLFVNFSTQNMLGLNLRTSINSNIPLSHDDHCYNCHLIKWGCLKHRKSVMLRRMCALVAVDMTSACCVCDTVVDLTGVDNDWAIKGVPVLLKVLLSLPVWLTPGQPT